MEVLLAKRLVCAIAIIVGSLAQSMAWGAAGDLRLTPNVTDELNLVLKVCDSLHKSLLAQNDEQIDVGLREVIVQLVRAKSASTAVKPHERSHLLRILDAALEQFELTQGSIGDERRARLTEGFNQVVNLVRIYRLDGAYSIYFCPKDQTTWVQRGSRAQNPFRNAASQETCAMRVPK